MFSNDARVRELQLEVSDLRDELSRKRYEEQERADELERERKAARKRLNPSNRLYNGEITNFREAIVAHIQCIVNELNGSWVQGDDEESVKFRADFAGYQREADALLAEYEATIGEAERALFTRWVEEGEKGSTKRTAGECGLSGDYSSLAV